MRNASTRARKPEPPEEVADIADHPGRFVARRRGALGRRLGLEGIRRTLGLTQVELAERLGVSQASVSQTEASADDGDPQLSTVTKYVAAFGGTVEVIAVINGRRYRVR